MDADDLIDTATDLSERVEAMEIKVKDLQESIAKARNDALEQAALTAEDCDHAHSCEGPQIAREIRALKSPDAETESEHCESCMPDRHETAIGWAGCISPTCKCHMKCCDNGTFDEKHDCQKGHP